MAPSESAKSVLGTTNSESTSKRVPNPSHETQAPYGELKLKLRGSNSSKDFPSLGRLKWIEKVRRSDCFFSLRISTCITPSASFSAVSIESVSLLSMPSRITSRSTITEMSCIS